MDLIDNGTTAGFRIVTTGAGQLTSHSFALSLSLFSVFASSLVLVSAARSFAVDIRRSDGTDNWSRLHAWMTLTTVPLRQSGSVRLSSVLPSAEFDRLEGQEVLPTMAVITISTLFLC